MMRQRTGYILVSIFLLFLSLSKAGAENLDNTYVSVAHMANHASIVDWAVNEGANGIEIDLNFYNNGKVKGFMHGGACDCTGICPDINMCNRYNVCRVLWNRTGDNCNTFDNPSNMMSAIARNSDKLALVYIDSKLSSAINKKKAGKEVIKMLDQAFKKGYRGEVLIGVSSIKDNDYLQSAVHYAKQSIFKDKYFFTIDGEGSNFFNTMEVLFNLTPNRVYSTGITAFIAKRFYTAVQLAAMNKQKNSIAAVAIWSIDDPKAMRDYLDLGANIIITNEPKTLKSVLEKRKINLAKPGKLYLETVSNDIIGYGKSECSSNDECINDACGRKTAANNAPLVCCKTGKIHNYGGFDYCADLPDGSLCWSDDMCATGYCRNNQGGTRKGICGKNMVGQICSIDSDCLNDACGRKTAADHAQKICCPSGITKRYLGFDYCGELPRGAVCWSDEMCASKYCKGNLSGFRKGICR